MKGQGNTQTPNNFEIHWVVKNIASGKFYDPSFGKGPYNTPKDHEDDAIPGFFKKLGVQNPLWCTKKNEVGTAELEYKHDATQE